MHTHHRNTLRCHWVKLLSVALGTIFALGCGSSGDSGSAETTYGATLNAAYVVSDITCAGTFTSGTISTGSFSVAVNGTMSTCVNATAPTAEVENTKPTGLDIASYESNLTKGATSYKLTLGDSPYVTDTDTSVTVTVPFTVGAVPALKQNSTYIFLRILNLNDNSLVDVISDVDTTTELVTATLMGLPPSMSVSVIYNPNMVAHTSTGTASTSIAVPTRGKATSRTWGASKYCVLYDSSDALVTSALTTYQVANPTATLASMVETTVAASAVAAQDAYVAAGFRQAALVIKAAAKYPCGDTLGTTPRFFIHYANAGSSFNPSVIEFFGTYIPAVLSDNNYYGSLYISPNRANLTTADTLGPIAASVAHEMFHSVQYGYDVITWQRTTQGYIEGTATTYGRSIAMASPTVTPVARPGNSQIFMLSNFVTQNAADDVTRVDNIAYTNQDFFAFVGRKYGANSLAYLEDLFDQISTDIAIEAGFFPRAYYEPSRSLLFGSMNTSFVNTLTGAPSLSTVYIDFLRQRAMEHDTASQLHSGEPTTSGTFASGLFEVQAANGGKGLIDVSIDPLAVAGQSFKFGSVAPLAARAIRITPSQVIAAGGTGASITVAVSPVGSSFSGATYQNGAYQGALSTTTTFTGFGMAATNEIVILVANIQTTADTPSDVTITLSGTNGTGGGGGGSTSTFSLTDFSLPGEGTWTPAYVYIMTDIASIGVIDGLIFSDVTQSYALKNLQVQFGTGTITGAGTYTITGDDPFTGPAAVLYSPGTNAAAAGTGKVYTSFGGTITITTWGTALGDHITGSVAATMQTDDTPPVTGTLGATFDFVLGSFNPL